MIYALLEKQFAEKGAFHTILGQLLGYSESLRASDRGLLQCLSLSCLKSLNKKHTGLNQCKPKPLKYILL